MRLNRILHIVDAHGEGEVGRVVVGGVRDVPGKTMLEKMDYLNHTDDSLRRFCVLEPRGCAQMSTNLLLPPTVDGADAGVLIMQADQVHGASGSNFICIVTVLLETGMVPMREPRTTVKLDSPVGLVTAVAECRDGKCERVSIDMVPAFAEQLDVEVEVDGIGKVRADVAFGGVYFALVDPAQLGLEIAPESARALVDAGNRIHRAISKKVSVRHPTLPSVNHIAYTMFVSRNADGELCGANVMPPGRIDRSPCGTGNCARLAVRHARGEVAPGETMTARSIINSRIELEFLSQTELEGRPAVLARVSGRGWIYGLHQIGVDPSDPYPRGYLLSDTWGDGLPVGG